MKGLWKRLCLASIVTALLAHSCLAQKALTWQEVRDKFEAANPSLRAGQIGVDESRANEITAYLRPNPNLTLSTDGTQIAPNKGVWQPLIGTQFSANFSYLHERQHKREFRLDSAKEATGIAVSNQSDLGRTLLFNLRSAFVQTLQEKSVRDLAKENLSYYDHVLNVNRDRYHAGAIAQVDLDRLELQRVQYESDLQTAEVNLRTAKIQMLALLNDRTPVEQFDVTGPFDFSTQIAPLDDVRQIAVDNRPDLKAALQSLHKAETDHRLAVADLEESVAWFCDVFGLVPELTLRVDAIDLSIEMLIHPSYGYRLELLHRPGSAADRKPGTPAEAALRDGYGHVAFDVADLDAGYDRALARGARPVMPPGPSPEPGVRMAFVADPEGNLVELLHRPTEGPMPGP